MNFKWTKEKYTNTKTFSSKTDGFGGKNTA